MVAYLKADLIVKQCPMYYFFFLVLTSLNKIIWNVSLTYPQHIPDFIACAQPVMQQISGTGFGGRGCAQAYM